MGIVKWEEGESGTWTFLNIHTCAKERSPKLVKFCLSVEYSALAASELCFNLVCRAAAQTSAPRRAEAHDRPPLDGSAPDRTCAAM